MPEEPHPPRQAPGFAIVLLALVVLFSAALVSHQRRPILRGDAPPVRSPLLKIDMNSATEAELQLLPMIGPALAQRIVEDRLAHGRFETLDDLNRVWGLGPATVSRIEPYAMVE